MREVRRAKKSLRFRRERIWVDLACLEMEENVCLKLWVKLGCSPQCTPIVQKSHLDGHMAGSDFSHTHARGATRGATRKKKPPFSPGANLGGFGLLRNGGKRMFEIMG